MRIHLFILFLSYSLSGFSQEEIKLWARRPPGSIENRSIQEKAKREADGVYRISDVTDPSITVFHPAPEKNNNTAVIICPGGGYKILAFEKEGTDIAKWFADNGITGIVLKYRLPDATIMENKSIGPLDDVMQSMKIVKNNAKDWGIDTNKIGIMGFSAGGHLAASASTLLANHKGLLPDFSILLYPVISMKDSIGHMGSRINLLGLNPTFEDIWSFSCEEQVTKKTPPAFIVHSADDKSVPPENSLLYFRALQRYDIPSELHIYQTGGHGYGMPASGTHASWPERCLDWMKNRGLIDKMIE